MSLSQPKSPEQQSARAAGIQPFHVMDLLARAQQLQAEGRSIIHLEVGEPDFATAQPIIEAGIEALRQGRTHYTSALGLSELRKAIASHYAHTYNVSPGFERIIITPGASGALQLALSALADPGDSILLSDPGYPCNRNIARVLGIDTISVAVEAASGYHISAQDITEYWAENTRAAMVASPSNPTGTIIEQQQLQQLITAIHDRNGHLVIDEIYQGLIYEQDSGTAMKLSDDVFVINSFSKYFGMTGWRLGWLVVPEGWVETIDRMAQNLFLAAPTLSQYAALAAFSDEVERILQQRVAEFKQRRDFFLPELVKMGFNIEHKPEGAFYIYADCSAFTNDSFTWAHELLETEGVAVTPGIDFGEHRANVHVRFAYTRPIEQLQEACVRIARFVQQ